MKLKEKRAGLVKEANDLVAERKSAGAELSAEDRTKLQGLIDQVKGIDKDLEDIAKGAELKSALEGLGSTETGTEIKGDGTGGDGKATEAKSLGDHFVKSVGENVSVLGMRGGKLDAGEFKAPATQTTTWPDGVPILTDYDRTIVQARRERPTIADLCGSGTISGNAISYFVEAAMQGGFATVAEGGAKPQISFDNPTAIVDALKEDRGLDRHDR